MADLLLEPVSGLAGDMLLAALLDLDDPRFRLDDLRALAQALVPGECELEARRAWRGNLSGTLLDVRTPESARPPHRRYADLERLVRAADLSAGVVERTLAVLRRIAEAEARVHGTTPEEIHFHEIGAVDTLIDVCGAAFALERLEVERVLSLTPATGEGTVRCAHGEMPVPVPAVVELLRGRALLLGGGSGERLTPTGAALLAELVPRFGPAGPFRAERVGYGAGHADPVDGPPNVLRVQLGEARVQLGESSERAPAGGRAPLWQLELNLDDMTGEELAVALEALRAAGALDVWTLPAQMKKGRPGVIVQALARDDGREDLERAVFEHTTTLGLRWLAAERRECGRRTLEVELEGRRVRVKLRERPAYAGASPLGERDLSPEHDDLAALAAASGLSLRELERRAVEAALRLLQLEGRTSRAEPDNTRS